MSSISAARVVFACLISALPGPPGIRYEDSYFQLFPIDKTKCPTIDPVRDIAYQLYTRNNPLVADALRIGDDEALARSHMNYSDPTVIFFQAFFESSVSLTAWNIRTAYLQKKQHNIIFVNAPRLEAGPWFFTAARNTRVIGEYTAKFIDYLVSRGMPLHSLHLIGLSLGAQIAGVTGSNLRSGKVPRITGLDPAGPLFTKLPNSLKLDKSDAEFVDVIHTDAGIFGYPIAIGHADFWPTQGISPQPGCLFREIKKRTPDTIFDLIFCSHWRSLQFYAESVVNENGFLAVSCNSWNEYVTGKCDPHQQPIHMGYNVPLTARGNYYLTTNRESPFSLEGNPKTLAESKYIEKNNFYHNAEAMTEGEYQDLGNNMYFSPTSTDMEVLLQQNVTTLKESLYATLDNNYYPASNSEANHYLSEALPQKENLDNTHQNDDYLTSISETREYMPEIPPKNETVYNKHDNNNYYPTSSSETKHYIPEDSPQKENFYNTHNNNYHPTTEKNEYSSEAVPQKENVYYSHDNNYYPASKSETNIYFPEALPKKENLEALPQKENLHNTHNNNYHPTSKSETNLYFPETPPKKENIHNSYSASNSETKEFSAEALLQKGSVYNSHDYYYPASNYETNLYLPEALPKKEHIYNSYPSSNFETKKYSSEALPQEENVYYSHDNNYYPASNSETNL